MGIEQVIEHLRDRRKSIPDDDPRRFFHDTYTRATEAIGASLDSGIFVDPDWVERWDGVLAGYYLRALDTDMAGERPPGPWAVVLDAGRATTLPPLRLVVLGMSAHIGFDLPQSLVEVIEPSAFDVPGLQAHRELDLRAIDDILAAQVDAEARELAAVETRGDRTLVERLLRPLHRRGTQALLAESRANAWHNARLLSRARSTGSYQERLEELEVQAMRRLSDLVEPKRVIVDLRRDGVGIELTDE